MFSSLEAVMQWRVPPLVARIQTAAVLQTQLGGCFEAILTSHEKQGVAWKQTHVKEKRSVEMKGEREKLRQMNTPQEQKRTDAILRANSA
jgi:hypothetical protein